MKSFKLRTFYSSFWFVFSFSLLINQLLLLALIYFSVIEPVMTNVSQVFDTVLKATSQIDKRELNNSGEILQNTSPTTSTVAINNIPQNFEEIPFYYFGLRVFKQSLEKRLGGHYRVGYNPKDEALIIQSVDQSGVGLSLHYKGVFLGVRIIGLALLLALTISGLAALWISAKLIRPLEHLSKSAYQLGKNQDFKSISILPHSPKEIARLTDTFNAMRKALDASISERESLLADVTHDVRTPLSRMRMAIELEGNRNTEFTSGLLEDVIEMSAILDQFNELSRLNLEVTESWVMGDIAKLAIAIQAKYERAGIQLNLTQESNLPKIAHKPLALTRLLYNLIDNAFQHGNGAISIHIGQFSRLRREKNSCSRGVVTSA